jgi:cobalt-zinc-cadmium efflux system membrane fusion protein
MWVRRSRFWKVRPSTKKHAQSSTLKTSEFIPLDFRITTFDASGNPEGHSAGVLPIRAPISGTIVERNVVIGQLVDVSTLVFRIINSSTLWAEGQVSEDVLPMLYGKPDIKLTVTSFPAKIFTGKVVYISPIVDEHTRTITIRASIPNRDGLLKPQMFGALQVPVGGTRNGLLIPLEAIQKEGDSPFVFVAKDETQFVRRNVTLGVSIDSMVEVLSGIKPGERVVGAGSFQLKSELLKGTLEEEE